MRVLGWFQNGGMVRFMMVLFFFNRQAPLPPKCSRIGFRNCYPLLVLWMLDFKDWTLGSPILGAQNAVFFLHLFTSFLGSALVCCLGRLVKGGLKSSSYGPKAVCCKIYSDSTNWYQWWRRAIFGFLGRKINVLRL